MWNDALKLNEHFSSSSSYIRIKKEHLLFTDWEVDEEGRAFGIEGVEEVKEFIKNHLVELNVIGKGNITELEAASIIWDSVKCSCQNFTRNLMLLLSTSEIDEQI